MSVSLKYHLLKIILQVICREAGDRGIWGKAMQGEKVMRRGWGNWDLSSIASTTYVAHGKVVQKRKVHCFYSLKSEALFFLVWVICFQIIHWTYWRYITSKWLFFDPGLLLIVCIFVWIVPLFLFLHYWNYFPVWWNSNVFKCLDQYSHLFCCFYVNFGIIKVWQYSFLYILMFLYF